MRAKKPNKRKFEEDDCAICMQQLDQGAQGQGAQGQGAQGQGAQRQGAQRQGAQRQGASFQLPCRHVLHVGCWRRSCNAGHNKCPICRRQAPPPPHPRPPPSLAVRSAAALQQLRHNPGFFGTPAGMVAQVERCVQAVLQQWATEGQADEMIESEDRRNNALVNFCLAEETRINTVFIASIENGEDGIVGGVPAWRLIKILRDSFMPALRVLRSMALNP